MPTLDEHLTRLDRLIRAGKGGVARREIEGLAERRVPRDKLADVARLCWRVHAPQIGIRLLHAVVRPPPKRPTEATEAERAEYAHCLARAGADHEAWAILEGLDPERLPRVLFYRMTVLVGRWDYASAVPLLRRYLSLVSPRGYLHLVGRVNLAAALIYERRYREVRALLSDLLHETTLRRLQLLRGNVLELSALSLMGQRRWDRAEELLGEAERALSESEALDELVVRKWRAILAVRRAPKDPRAAEALARVRAEAVERRHWETVRECDRYRAIATGDRARLTRLYYGTPFAEYRERLIADFGKAFEPRESYVWKLGPGSTSVLDLLSGDADGGGRGLKPGSAPYRLLHVMVSDFYRPFRLVELYARTFPGEYYNPETSPWRVHQAVKELRARLSRLRLPLEVVVTGGDLRLESRKGCGIRVPRPCADEAPSRERFMLARLRGEVPGQDFSLTDASQVLGISSRSTLRVLSQGMRQGTVVRIGSRAFTRYRFAG